MEKRSKVEIALGKHDEKLAQQAVEAAEQEFAFRKNCRSLGYGLNVHAATVTATDREALHKFLEITEKHLSDSIRAELIDLGMKPEEALKTIVRLGPVAGDTGEHRAAHFMVTIFNTDTYRLDDASTKAIATLVGNIQKVSLGSAMMRGAPDKSQSFENLSWDGKQQGPAHAVKIAKEFRKAGAYLDYETGQRDAADKKWPRFGELQGDDSYYAVGVNLFHDKKHAFKYESGGSHGGTATGYARSRHYLTATNLDDLILGLNTQLSEKNRIDFGALKTELDENLWVDHRLIERSDARAWKNSDLRAYRDQPQEILDYAATAMDKRPQEQETLLAEAKEAAAKRGMSMQPLKGGDPIDLTDCTTLEKLNPERSTASLRDRLRQRWKRGPELADVPLHRVIADGHYEHLLAHLKEHGLHLEAEDFILGLKQNELTILDHLIQQGYLPEVLERDHWNEWDDAGHLLVAANVPRDYLEGQTGRTMEQISADFGNTPLGARVKALQCLPTPEEKLEPKDPLLDAVSEDPQVLALQQRVHELEQRVRELSAGTVIHDASAEERVHGRPDNKPVID